MVGSEGDNSLNNAPIAENTAQGEQSCKHFFIGYHSPNKYSGKKLTNSRISWENIISSISD
jgi:hypothetical protein